MEIRQTLLQQFHEFRAHERSIREGATTSDYPFLLANVMHKALLKKFRGVVSPWQQYVLKGNLSDFKTHDRVILGEAPDLVPVSESGEYVDSKFGESRYQIALETLGRKWNVTRKAIINDDLGGLLAFPEMYGRASARTMAKACAGILETNPLAYDGNALFSSRTINGVAWNNDGHVSLTADLTGINTLDTARKTIRISQDPHSGEIMGIGSKLYLIVSPAKSMVANWLRTATQVRGGSSSTLVENPMAGQFEVLEDPFLTRFPNRAYLCVAPDELHFAEMGLLNGKVEPDILARAAQTVRVGGGDDPYGFDIDDMEFKIRHDFKVQPAFYQGVYKIGD